MLYIKRFAPEGLSSVAQAELEMPEHESGVSECHRDLPAQPPGDVVTLDKSIDPLNCFYQCAST